MMPFAHLALVIASVSLVPTIATPECHFDDATSFLQLEASARSGDASVPKKTGPAHKIEIEPDFDAVKLENAVSAVMDRQVPAVGAPGAALNITSSFTKAMSASFGIASRKWLTVDEQWWRGWPVVVPEMQKNLSINASYEDQQASMSTNKDAAFGNRTLALENRMAARLLHSFKDYGEHMSYYVMKNTWVKYFVNAWRSLWGSGYDPFRLKKAFNYWLQDLNQFQETNERDREASAATAERDRVTAESNAAGAAQVAAAQAGAAKPAGDAAGKTG